MFAKSKTIRLALWACLAATWLPIGNGPLQPAKAKAAEIVRVGPIVRTAPIVRVGPVVPVAPVVRVAPVVPRPLYPRFGFRWYGFRWVR